MFVSVLSLGSYRWHSTFIKFLYEGLHSIATSIIADSETNIGKSNWKILNIYHIPVMEW